MPWRMQWGAVAGLGVVALWGDCLKFRREGS